MGGSQMRQVWKTRSLTRIMDELDDSLVKDEASY